MIFTRSLNLFIEENICVFILLKFELCLCIFIFSSKSFFLYLLGIDLIHKLIIKTVPFVIWLHKWIVVPSLWCSWMNYCAPQNISKVCLWLWLITSKIICCIFLHIKHLREFEIAVNLYLSHLVKVKLESFKNNRQDVWQLLDAKSLQCPYLLLA